MTLDVQGADCSLASQWPRVTDSVVYVPPRKGDEHLYPRTYVCKFVWLQVNEVQASQRLNRCYRSCSHRLLVYEYILTT